MQFFFRARAGPFKVGNSIWHFLFRGVARCAFILNGDIAELKSLVGLRGHWNYFIGPRLRPLSGLGFCGRLPVRWFGVGEPSNHFLIRGFSLVIWLLFNLCINMFQGLFNCVAVPETVQVGAFTFA